MAEQKVKVQREFYGGIVRDEKSKVRGSLLNCEELDIFENADYIEPTQIMSSDSMPASTEVYAYTADEDDVVWGYGKETSGNKVRLVKVTSGGADNPGAFATQFTSADATDVAYTASPIAYLRRDDGDFLYYVTNASGTVRLKSFAIASDTESEQDSGATAMTLSQLDGSYDKISMRVIFGTLYITNGKYISSVDKDGVFTEAAFTLPNGWEAVDIVEASDIAIILARNVNRLTNECKGYWWDLTSTLQFSDSFDLPFGGPQWITKFKEQIVMLCAQNGKMRMYVLSGAFPGAVPIQLNVELTSVSSETTTQVTSPARSVDTFEGVLHFVLNKTDKPGIYALGQLDREKPLALVLQKRFATTDYSNHTAYDLIIQGPNFYGAFDDNGTASNSRCETNNSPTRSSAATLRTIIIDDDDPTTDKHIQQIYTTTQPVPASCDLNCSLATDYGSASEIFRPDGTSFNTQNGLIGYFQAHLANAKVWDITLDWTSNTTDAIKLTGIGHVFSVDNKPATD